MGDSPDLKNRTKDFALRIIRLIDSLPPKVSSQIVGKQIIRSATSIGANYRAACRSRSAAEFVSKMHTVQEEADETQYWLEILRAEGAIRQSEFEELHTEAKELTAIFTASEKTARMNIKSNRLR